MSLNGGLRRKVSSGALRSTSLNMCTVQQSSRSTACDAFEHWDNADALAKANLRLFKKFGRTTALDSRVDHVIDR